MSDTVDPPARRDIREKVQSIGRSIKALRLYDIPLDQLESLPIRIDELVLDEASSKKPSYFAPFPSHLIPDANEETLGEAYNGQDDETEACFTRGYDRSHVMNGHLSYYLQQCNFVTRAETERTPWTSKW
ncbi:hypothetical protein FE257_006169 [Aspergillus nanangensis]|uniref:Uncharacterized protein n=1 Tax=Aspergillus nanangensis TaxID=2582783 RepID=A0AAD4CPG9_ASPNN|nr:hypothetical protein FE257_006169 [Aspergillus nanangensis]